MFESNIMFKTDITLKLIFIPYTYTRMHTQFFQWFPFRESWHVLLNDEETDTFSDTLRLCIRSSYHNGKVTIVSVGNEDFATI